MTSEGIKKEIGVARIAFEGRFRAFVGYQSPEENPLSRERDLIQVFILSLTRVLFLLGENKQAPLLLQFIQQAMGDTVTPQGLKRPTITAKGQDLLAEEPQASEYSMTLRLIQNEDGRSVDLVLPVGEEGHFYPASILFFLQYLIRNLGEPSLFYLILTLAGLMEFYGGIGKTNDLNALSSGPVHAFKAADEYIEREKKRNEGNPAR